MAVGHSEHRSGDESIHGTVEMHDFFPAGQAVAKLQMQKRQRRTVLWTVARVLCVSVRSAGKFVYWPVSCLAGHTNEKPQC